MLVPVRRTSVCPELSTLVSGASYVSLMVVLIRDGACAVLDVVVRGMMMILPSFAAGMAAGGLSVRDARYRGPRID
jgi:hypothetical protein